MSKLISIVGDKRVRIAKLVDAELKSVQWVNTPGLSESECPVSEKICAAHDSSSAETSFEAPGPSAGGSSHQAEVLSIYGLFSA